VCAYTNFYVHSLVCLYNCSCHKASFPHPGLMGSWTNCAGNLHTHTHTHTLIHILPALTRCSRESLSLCQLWRQEVLGFPPCWLCPCSSTSRSPLQQSEQGSDGGRVAPGTSGRRSAYLMKEASQHNLLCVHFLTVFFLFL